MYGLPIGLAMWAVLILALGLVKAIGFVALTVGSVAIGEALYRVERIR